jgi:hypothetical protein
MLWTQLLPWRLFLVGTCLRQDRGGHRSCRRFHYAIQLVSCGLGGGNTNFAIVFAKYTRFGKRGDTSVSMYS